MNSLPRLGMVRAPDLQRIFSDLRLSGTDGMIIIWAPSANPNQGIYGSDLPPDELSLDKEFWKPRTTFRYAYILLCLQLLRLIVRIDAQRCRYTIWHGVRPASTLSPAAPITQHASLLQSMVHLFHAVNSSIFLMTLHRQVRLRISRALTLRPRCCMGPSQ